MSNFSLLNELDLAMEANPGMNVVDVIYTAIRATHPSAINGYVGNDLNKSGGWPKTNSFIHKCLTDYNTMRFKDNERHHASSTQV